MELPPEIWREILSYNILPSLRRVCQMFDQLEISLTEERLFIHDDPRQAIEGKDWDYLCLYASEYSPYKNHSYQCCCDYLCMWCTPDSYRLAFMLIDRCIGEIDMDRPPDARYLRRTIFGNNIYNSYEAVLASCACIDGREDILQLLCITGDQWRDLAIESMKRQRLSIAKYCIRQCGYRSDIYNEAWKLGHLDIISFMMKKFVDKKGRWKNRRPR